MSIYDKVNPHLAFQNYLAASSAHAQSYRELGRAVSEGINGIISAAQNLELLNLKERELENSTKLTEQNIKESDFKMEQEKSMRPYEQALKSAQSANFRANTSATNLATKLAREEPGNVISSAFGRALSTPLNPKLKNSTIADTQASIIARGIFPKKQAESGGYQGIQGLQLLSSSIGNK